MTVICCKCKKNMGKKPGDSQLISHGYCDECAREIREDLEKLKTRRQYTPDCMG